MTRVLLSVVCALLTIGATSGLPESDRSHDQWLQERYFEATSIKEGMTRADLVKIFRMDGGLQPMLPTRYVLKSSSFIKVDVEFDVPEGDKAVPEDLRFEMDYLKEGFRYISNDMLKIKRISRPYVEPFSFD
jgi:hypothetical protein